MSEGEKVRRMEVVVEERDKTKDGGDMEWNKDSRKTEKRVCLCVYVFVCIHT